MSRSYKKTPIIKDNGRSKKVQKRFANRRVRNYIKHNDIGKGKQYRKLFDSWEIADYVSRWTKEDAIRDYNSVMKGAPSYAKDYYLENFPTLESFLEFWERSMRKK